MLTMVSPPDRSCYAHPRSRLAEDVARYRAFRLSVTTPITVSTPPFPRRASSAVPALSTVRVLTCSSRPQPSAPGALSPMASTTTHSPAALHVRKERERPPVPLLLSSFPAPPSHIPPSPLISPSPGASVYATPIPPSPGTSVYATPIPPSPGTSVYATPASGSSGSPFSSAFSAALGRPPSSLSSHMSPPTPSHPGPSSFRSRSPRPSVESSYALPRVSSSSSISRNPPPTLPPSSPLPALPDTPSPISDETLIMFRSSLSSAGHSRRASGSSFASYRSAGSGSRAAPHPRGFAAALRSRRMSGASLGSSASESESSRSTGRPSPSPSVATSTFTSLPSKRDSMHSMLSVKSAASLAVPSWTPGTKGVDVRSSILEEEDDDDDLASIMARYDGRQDSDDDGHDTASRRQRDSIASIDMADLPPLTMDDLTVNPPPHSASLSATSSRSPYSTSTFSLASGGPLTQAFLASVTSLGHTSEGGYGSEAAYDATSPIDPSTTHLAQSPLSATSPVTPLTAGSEGSKGDPIDPYAVHLEIRAVRSKSRMHKHELMERSQSRGVSPAPPTPSSSSAPPPVSASADGVAVPGGSADTPGRASPDIRTILQRTPRPTRSLTPKSSLSSSSSRSKSNATRKDPSRRSATESSDLRRTARGERDRSRADRPGTSDTVRPGTGDTIKSATASAKFRSDSGSNDDASGEARSSANMPSSTASSSTASSTEFSKVVRSRESYGEDEESLVDRRSTDWMDERSRMRRSDSGGTFGPPAPEEEGEGRKRSDSGSVGVGMALMRNVKSDESLRSEDSHVSDYGVQIESALGHGSDAGMDQPEDETRLEREMEGGASDSDSSLDLHTPLPHLMFRDGLLSPRSKLFSQTMAMRSASPDAVSVQSLARPGSMASMKSTSSNITKSGIFKDERDTVRRRTRHRDGKLLRGGIGLTTGLGWSDSEDEDAPSPLTRRLSTLTGTRRSSESLVLSRSTSRISSNSPHPLSRSFSAGTSRQGLSSTASIMSVMSTPAPATRTPPTSWHQKGSNAGHGQKTSSGSAMSGFSPSIGIPEDPEDAPSDKVVHSQSMSTPRPARSAPGLRRKSESRSRAGSNTSASSASVNMPVTPADGHETPVASRFDKELPALPQRTASTASARSISSVLPRVSHETHLPRPRTLSNNTSTSVSSRAAARVAAAATTAGPASMAMSKSTSSVPSPKIGFYNRTPSAPPRPLQLGQRQPGEPPTKGVLGYNRNVHDQQRRAVSSTNTSPTSPMSVDGKPKPRIGAGMVYRTASNPNVAGTKTGLRMPSAKTSAT
ncbi:hypothetical protein PUNSTDRAFT_140557 [Punctularia strigosozonata HHB-11173 SS5]|uniref:uncharacterized protein n=1 Tax=Punctularia strigosozonata (strain HHB-11173) TaxID=741275 RepID=UPI00044163B7|nr:uncharacterized protein PUNSTDRAFT_140557 [Punctularia strigosozonata HHB-11173 SS5]EIN14221.1 hypothetical protein PUNSTDRAFT_140557 [Punctularia strigosozonata HHB-11173 SS5]